MTGRNASGKGTVASFLMKSSFVYHSLSDTLRAELKSKNLEESRENLIRIGNVLREEGGPGILADLMVPNLNSLENHIVDSIYHLLNNYIEKENEIYLIMEYSEGTTIHTYIKEKSGPIVEGRLIKLFLPSVIVIAIQLFLLVLSRNLT